MSSMADEIVRVVDPGPSLPDPEDDFVFDYAVSVNEKHGCRRAEPSVWRKNTALLDEIDSKYCGHKISRKLLEETTSEGQGDDEKSNCSVVYSDLDDVGTCSRLPTSNQCSDESCAHKEEALNSSSHLQGSSCAVDDADDDEASLEVESEGSSEDDMVQQFSEVNVLDEVGKGKAIKLQQELWNKLCECRIRLQKLIMTTNRLPQPDLWNEFIVRSDKSYEADLSRGQDLIRRLLNDFVDFQDEFLKVNINGTNDLGHSDAVLGSCDNNDSDDATSKEESNVVFSDSSDKCFTEQNGRQFSKRKLCADEYSDILAKRHEQFIPFRNSSIQKWDEKTRLNTGHVTQKSFNMFDQSVLNQIKQVLVNKPRLIKRTQLKRTPCDVLGKIQTHTAEENTPDVTQKAGDLESFSDHDPELFDDGDFYRQLLKDVIQSKSFGIDSVMLGKQLDIQKARSRLRHKVDTKASKGRKIRFDVHPKLVNFMAPVCNLGMTSEAVDELFHSVFGQHRSISVLT